ncbi:hypothetical protein [Komagataeibacter sp. FXV3]|uniref:hypothetical protein n=1 Tax=Komagataeibacter sp. FXV3 TaxID=2608998 RepID=UPI00187BC44D|nr:hypothetical protein [Komagataeibacter sp. FXV3]MBE7728656.1 hypothetical protein [Komagataeibacter sp. FXV3]
MLGDMAVACPDIRMPDSLIAAVFLPVAGHKKFFCKKRQRPPPWKSSIQKLLLFFIDELFHNGLPTIPELDFMWFRPISS